MTRSPIHLIVPDPDIDPGDEPVTPLFISPDGADPNRETPGFFIIQLDSEPVWAEASDAAHALPKQFLSLDAVHAYLSARFGWKVPLPIIRTAKIPGNNKFPVIWGADRRHGRKRVQVRARYLGSFRYWDGRMVDPTKVGTQNEFD